MRTLWLGIAALSAVALSPPVARGHEEAEVEAPQEAVETIPMSSVAERAEGLSNELRRVRRSLEPLRQIESIGPEVDERADALQVKRAETATLLAGHATLPTLTELERSWTRQRIDFDRWRRELTRRASALGAEIEALDKRAQVWAATLEQATTTNAPAVVVDAIRDSMTRLGAVRGEADARRAKVLALQSRVSTPEHVVADALVAVQDARAGLRSRLFEPDRPPIWAAFEGEAEDAAQRVANAFVGGSEVTWVFVRQRSGRVVIFLVILVLAYLGANGLKRSVVAHGDGGGEVDDSARVFQRPVALAAFLALLSVYWLFPLAPSAFLDLVGLLILVPLLRLMPLLVERGFRPILYCIAAFYVVDRLRHQLEGAPLEGRLLFAVECAAAAAFCFALLRPARLLKIPDPERFPRWLGRAVRLAFALFSIAFVANLAGWVALSTLLGEGLLNSVYFAVALYAGVRVFEIVLDSAVIAAGARQLHFLRSRGTVVVSWAKRVVSIGAGLLWAYMALGAFAIQDAVLGTALEVLTAPLPLGSLTLSTADILSFLATITAAILVARVVRFVLMEDVFPRVRTGRGVPHAVSATVYYLLVAAGVFLAIAASGIDFSRFALLAGAIGVGLGFGLQSIVNNFVSGIVLLYERPIQVGDTIDMGDLIGRVRRIGIRSSTIRSLSGSEVIVPNADLISQRVINWTLSDRNRRIELPIGVDYGSDPEQVIRILTDIAEKHERVLKYPTPVVLFRRHGDSSLDFEVRAWIANFDDSFAVASELNIEINRALADAKIGIPFPQRDLHLRSVAPEVARDLARGADPKSRDLVPGADPK